jgi:hypothetical protein
MVRATRTPTTVVDGRDAAMADDQEGRSIRSVASADAWVSREEVSAADLVAHDALRGVVGLALGAAGLALLAVRELLEISSRPAGTAALVASERAAALPNPGEGLWRVVRAAAGLGVEAQRRCLGAAATVGGPLATVASAVLETAGARGPLAAVGHGLGRWSEQGLAEQRRNQDVALASSRAAVRSVVAAVLAEADLDAVVARVDLDAVVARVDLDRIVDRLDIDRVAGRIDLDTIAARLDLDAVAARLDVNAVVDRVDLPRVTARVLDSVDIDAIAARLDLDAVAARLDVNAVVDRVDLARITEQVLDEVDVGHIVRESSGAMAAETVDAVRMQGIRVDGFLSRVVDRLLARPGGRNTAPLPVPDVVGIERA